MWESSSSIRPIGPQPESRRTRIQSSLQTAQDSLRHPINGGGARSAVSRASGRRGHFKSRTGCYNCKRRRVKCNELWPQCSQCRRLVLDCVYPPSRTAAATAGQSLRANPSTLGLEDLKFYHQFMVTAFPPVPIDGEKSWQECTAMSHQYEFLAHAMLGLGASHLSLHTNANYHSKALQHRLISIRQINELLISPPKDQAKLDAMLAALFCLITQSTLIDDGLIDYVAITRGGQLIATVIMKNDMTNSVFPQFTLLSHVKAIGAAVREDQRDDLDDLEDFGASVAAMAALVTEPHEVAFHRSLANIHRYVQHSSLGGWLAYGKLWLVLMDMSNKHFQGLVDPDNHVSRMLIIHMFLVAYALGRVCMARDTPVRFPQRKSTIIKWARACVARLPARLRPYGAWMSSYSDKLETFGPCASLFSP